MTAPNHPFNRELTGVRLARHLGEAHGYHSSNDLEDFSATHRRLHGVPSANAEYLRAQLAKVWDEGYEAGSADQEALWMAKASGPDTVENLMAEGGTPNPYTSEIQPVSTTPAQTNPELWKD